MFGRSFKIASIGGIAIEINPSWFLIVGLLSWTLADTIFPEWYEGWSTASYWVMGVIAALSLFVSVLIHEMAHAVVAVRRGLPVPKITLFIFGGVSHLERQPRSAGEEFYIAAAGPLTSFGIALVTSLIGFAAHGRNEYIEGLGIYLALQNTVLGVFNLVPGFPLDGGRVFRSMVWKRTKSFRRATRIAAGTGEIVGYGMMLLGAFMLLSGFIFQGFWFGFIGWFLIGAARTETQNLQLESILGRLKARDVMKGDWATVVPGMSLQNVVDEQMIGAGERYVVVANGGAVAGILSVADIRRAPREEWNQIPAQRVMTPREKVVTVTADSPALEVLLLLAKLQLNQVPVLEDGRMVGIITRRELLERVQLVESLAPDEPDAA